MNWMLLAIGLSLALSVMAMAVALVALRASHRQLDQVRSSHRRLESELAVANSAAIGMGNRLIAMERRLAQGAGGASEASSEQDFPYTEANQLFRMGGSVEEVARRCGLSRAEASLLQAMQEHR
ncbi:DUF2802 domain-containing protein [Marinimicrobium sp. C6131]|uniref:DUF2802 domain-containing protein n=1 Tax=Marinimicrobium sp. C6131 TaxID=3022676 RepID=UPI00223E0636|nr:DUF2802 domain-containing protein [Marinimicrobium sp. C6131]UZJ45252.1 DUF2802 domain-containing protein [Marinimicrobium sp. C6131]